MQQGKNEFIWANLLHLGYNMWHDRDAATAKWAIQKGENYLQAKPYLRFDISLWNDLIRRMADAGMNMVVIDLGEGVCYESHPELGVKGAWSPGRLRRELAKVRKLGIEPIPKLNFSTAHDAWLGEYSRMVSTSIYYKVCAELIAEVYDLFDKPRLFHIGFDEETAWHQEDYNYVVVRQHELWWHDFCFFVREVERHNAQAWIWSDYVWHHPGEFYKKMPKSVLQSNWFYHHTLKRNRMTKEYRMRVNSYLDLDAHGYCQVPTASNYCNNTNFQATVDFCRKRLAPKRLKGFLQTPWRPTVECFRKYHHQAIMQVERAIKKVSDSIP